MSNLNYALAKTDPNVLDVIVSLDLGEEVLKVLDFYTQDILPDAMELLEFFKGYEFAMTNKRKTLGYVNHGKKRLCINHKLMMKGYEAELMDTFIHELCHIIIRFFDPNNVTRAHGKQWKHIMKCFGYNGAMATTGGDHISDLELGEIV